MIQKPVVEGQLPAPRNGAANAPLDANTAVLAGGLEDPTRIDLVGLTAVDAENASLRQSVAEAPSYRLVLVVAIGAVLAGTAAGYAMARALK